MGVAAWVSRLRSSLKSSRYPSLLLCRGVGGRPLWLQWCLPHCLSWLPGSRWCCSAPPRPGWLLQAGSCRLAVARRWLVRLVAGLCVCLVVHCLARSVVSQVVWISCIVWPSWVFECFLCCSVVLQVVWIRCIVWPSWVFERFPCLLFLELFLRGCLKPPFRTNACCCWFGCGSLASPFAWGGGLSWLFWLSRSWLFWFS